ncbi:MAG: hypothetical protein JNN00_11275 [Chitinophagaceae bacterium]|nr:hypothetical protein [Chitinophagaceae bacterium]
MRKTTPLLIIAFVLFISSCKTADNQVPEIAADFCKCISVLEKDMSKATVDVISRAAEAADPEQAMEKAMEGMSEEDKMKVAMEMVGMSKLDDASSEVGRCMKDVEKKYDKSYTFNEKKFGEKIIKELESKNGCGLTAAIMKLGLKVESKEKKD